MSISDEDVADSFPQKNIDKKGRLIVQENLVSGDNYEFVKMPNGLEEGERMFGKIYSG